MVSKVKVFTAKCGVLGLFFYRRRGVFLKRRFFNFIFFYHGNFLERLEKDCNKWRWVGFFVALSCLRALPQVVCLYRVVRSADKTTFQMSRDGFKQHFFPRYRGRGKSTVSAPRLLDTFRPAPRDVGADLFCMISPGFSFRGQQLESLHSDSSCPN